VIQFQSFLSSSSGNCTFVTDGSANFLVDCGAGGRYITECLRRIGVMPESITAILITHEHKDHMVGAGIISRKYNIPIYATEKTWTAMEDSIGRIEPSNRCITEPQMHFGKLTVSSFPIPHDAADPVGYSFSYDNEKFTIATDIGHVTDELLAAISGSQSLILEANHDVEKLQKGSYPFYLKKRILGELGHLSNAVSGEICARLAKTGTRDVWLGHLSAENNNPSLAYETIMSILKAQEDESARTLTVHVLPRYWIDIRS